MWVTLNVTPGEFTRLFVWQRTKVCCDYCHSGLPLIVWVCCRVLCCCCFFNLRVITNWVINGCNVTRKSESGASESPGYCPPSMWQHLCTISPFSVLCHSQCNPRDSHADSLLTTSGLALNLCWWVFFPSGYKTGSKLTNMTHVCKA